MGSTLKYLLIALFIVLIGSWLFTVAKSCNTSKTNNTSITGTSNDGMEGANEAEGEEESNLEDLYEVDESDVRNGNADRSASDEENLPDNANAGDDLELGDANAPDEDPLAERGDGESSSVSTGGATFGKYLVVTGSYLSEANAKIMAQQLRGYGYNTAEVLTFDLSQYYSVTTGRYNDLAEARAAARQVKQKGVEAYVHKMRGKKMNR